MRGRWMVNCTHLEVRPSIALAGAMAALESGLSRAERLDVHVAIAVVDPSGPEVAFAAMDGSPPISHGLARDKAWTAEHLGRSTAWWSEAVESDPELAHVAKYERLLPLRGGAPVLVRGRVAAAVGVSGASSTNDAVIPEVIASAVDAS